MEYDRLENLEEGPIELQAHDAGTFDRVQAHPRPPHLTWQPSSRSTRIRTMSEFLAGGTLALLADLGHQITIATFTPGDCGSKQLGPEEIADVRRREAANAAALIGARYVCLEMRDLAIFDDDASRRLVTETLRQTRPDLVLTASPSDYHCDHEAASALVRDACFAAPAPNYSHTREKPAPPLDHIPHLYFMDPVEGRDRDGRVVAAGFRRRYCNHLRPQARHARRTRQPAHLAATSITEPTTTSTTMERWTRERGALAGYRSAKASASIKGHAYPQNPLLEEWLGPAAVKFRK